MPRQGVNASGRGGAPRGAGRKRADRQRSERQRARRTMSAGDYILSKLNAIDPNTGRPFTESTRPSERWLDRLAILATPFFHPRLAPVRIKETEPKPPCALDLTKLTDDELDFLERILMKAQIPLQPKQPTEDLF